MRECGARLLKKSQTHQTEKQEHIYFCCRTTIDLGVIHNLRATTYGISFTKVGELQIIKRDILHLTPLLHLKRVRPKDVGAHVQYG